jgi:hypothetical protein
VGTLIFFIYYSISADGQTQLTRFSENQIFCPLCEKKPKITQKALIIFWVNKAEKKPIG